MSILQKITLLKNNKKCLKYSLKILILFFVSLFFVSCSDDPKKTNAADPTFTYLYTTLFGQDCRDCHMPGGEAYNVDGVQLDFTNASTAYNTLTSLKVTANVSVGSCGSVDIVGSTPETSFLAGTLFSDYNQNNFAGATGCQPEVTHIEDANRSSLANSVKSQLIQWIQLGAPNN